MLKPLLTECGVHHILGNCVTFRSDSESISLWMVASVSNKMIMERSWKEMSSWTIASMVTNTFLLNLQLCKAMLKLSFNQVWDKLSFSCNPTWIMGERNFMHSFHRSNCSCPHRPQLTLSMQSIFNWFKSQTPWNSFSQLSFLKWPIKYLNVRNH